MSEQAHGPEQTSAPASGHGEEGGLHIERWEGIWVRISFVLLAIFITAITIAAVAYNIQVPGVGGRIDPNALDAPGSPFANPMIRSFKMARRG